MKRYAFIIDSDGTTKIIKLSKPQWLSGKFEYGNISYNIVPSSVSRLSGPLFKSGVALFYTQGISEPINASKSTSRVWKIAMNSKVVADVLGTKKIDLATLIIYVVLSLVIGLLTGYIIGHDIIQSQGYKVVQLK